MKLKRRLIFLYCVVAVGIAILIKYFISSRVATVVKGTALMEKNNDWNYMISNYTNMDGINVNIDGNLVSSGLGGVYMDENRNMMISSKKLKTWFSCAANRYFKSTLVVEKGNNRVIYTAGNKIVSVNGVDEENLVAPTMVDDEIYIPLRQFCKLFNYDYKWDYDTNTLALNNTTPDEKIYPYKYDYRNDGKVMPIRNQANFGTCWAFASLTALSTTILPEHNHEFSVDHLCYHNGYSINTMEGGGHTMSMAYLAAWKGPVFENDDPYGDGVSPDGLAPEYHVQEIQLIDSKNFSDIKKSVFLYGGVQSSLYMTLNEISGNSSQFYNAETSSYCYIGTEKSNHDIVIVGWDDSYSANNFSTVPDGDGAFICMNSWGENFGENGYFYVSYYDSNIGIHNIVYTGVEDKKNYDNIYQTDLLGWLGQIGYGRESASFANVYEIKSDENLEAVSFYATGPNTRYEVYFIKDFKDTDSFNSKAIIAKGTLVNAGYYTVKLETPIELVAGEKCAIVVQITTPNSIHPVAIEYNSEELTDNVIIDDGEGYISSNEKKWERVELTQNCNVCLKIFTNNREEGEIIVS